MQRDTPSRLVGYARPSQDMSLLLKLDVSVERTSPRGYAFFVPLGGGERPFGITPTFARQRYYSKIAANQRGGQGRYGQNAGMGSAGRGGFRRRNSGIGAAGGARRRVLRTQSVGSPRLVAPFGAASPGDTRRQRKSLRRQRKVLRRQRKLLGRENAADRGGGF